MKVPKLVLLLSYVGVAVQGDCSNLQPVVYGFDNVAPFTFPPLVDAGCIPANNCVKFKTSQEISYNDLNSQGDEVTFKLTVDSFYNQSDTLSSFVSLCEELWILIDYIAQAAAQDGGFNRDSRGLCFGDAYYYAPDLNYARSKFIIQTCHGSKGTVAERLEKLADQVETNLALIEDKARQMTFVTTSPELASELEEAEDLDGRLPGDICGPQGDCVDNEVVCLEIAECYKDQFNDGFFSNFGQQIPGGADVELPTVDEIVGPSFIYSECFNVTYADLVAKKEGVCAPSDPSTSAGCSPYDFPDGPGGCPAGGASPPVCPSGIEGYFESFSPLYPNPTNNPSYGAAVISIQDSFLCKSGGAIDYTDRTNADAVGITLIVKIALESAKIATEVLKDALPDNFLYAWKILAFIINEIGLGTVDTILAQANLHDKLIDGAEVEGIYENSLQLLDGSASIYGEVVCHCTKEPRRGHGCDSIDNNCDKQVDECGEDTFAPEIDLSDAAVNCGSGNGRSNWFTQGSDALSCISKFASVADDCDTSVTLSAPVLEGTCADATVTLQAVDRCGNAAPPATVPVHLDNEAPTVSCSLGGTANKTLTIGETGASILTNVQLQYDATDNCGFDLDVQLDVYANEIEDLHNQKTAVFFRNTSLTQHRAGLYVAAGICSTNANGQCVKDPLLGNARVYTIVVSAKDAAGQSAVPAICQVVIKPSGQQGNGINPSVSKQRFHLDSYRSTFQDYLPGTGSGAARAPGVPSIKTCLASIKSSCDCSEANWKSCGEDIANGCYGTGTEEASAKKAKVLRKWKAKCTSS